MKSIFILMDFMIVLYYNKAVICLKIYLYLNKSGDIMKKKFLICTQIAALLLLITLSLLLIPDADRDNFQTMNSCRSYLENWTATTSSGSSHYDTLPNFIHTQNDRNLWITKTLQDVKNGDCIGFFSFQQQVSISLDGVEVYHFTPNPCIKSSTPGNKWNFFPLNPSYNGKEICIHIYQCYSANRVSIPRIYYGTHAGITLNYLRAEIPQVLISLLMVLFGIVLGIFCLLYQKKTNLERGLTWLALFAIFRGLWTTIESNTYSFMFTHLLLFSFVSYLCLKLAVVTFLQFLNTTFHKERSQLLRVLTLLSIADFWGTSFCQLVLGIDFANTVAITHIIMLVGGIYACITSINVLRGRDSTQESDISSTRKKSYIARIACTFALVIASFIDLIRYYAVNSPDISKYSRMGDLIYIAITSITLFIDFIFLLRMGHQAEQIKEEASIDPMTKIMNRAAFEHDIMEGHPEQWKHQSIVMLDLNNLKYFNDVHGHEAGDNYIITASQIIRDAFTKWGSAYRIGGDEFCIIATNFTPEDFKNVRDSVEKTMAEQRVLDSSVHMAISAGYAAFDPKIDANLRDTMKRADAFMYKRKMLLKQKSNIAKYNLR